MAAGAGVTAYVAPGAWGLPSSDPACLAVLVRHAFYGILPLGKVVELTGKPTEHWRSAAPQGLAPVARRAVHDPRVHEPAGVAFGYAIANQTPFYAQR